MELINIVYNLFADPFIQLAIWSASFIFMIGYAWTTKVDNTTRVQAAHVNLLQTEKIDRDGVIPFTGTSQWDKGADIASASTLVPGADGNCFDVTGTTTITAINAVQSQPGTVNKYHFDGILQIVHDGDDIILPDGKDIYTMAGTELEFVEYAANKWRCTGYLRGIPVLSNILTNSEIKVWSQSDANKGLCTLAYKTGAKGAGTAPSVGDACVGANGATGKVISYTIASGDWDTGDADGILTLGACTGSWTVDEVLTFDGVETAAVKSEAVGICNDPCNNDGTGDWTDADGILSFDTDHYEIASDAADEKTYITGLSFTEGKIYKVEAQLKDGTAEPTDIQLVSLDGAVVEYSSKFINTTAAFVTYFCTFEATADTDGVGIITPTSLGGNNIEMKYFICYEITPCCTATDTLAFDGWVKDATLDIYRQHNDGGTYTKDGSFYSLKMVPSTADDFIRFPGATHTSGEWMQQFAGRTVTVGCWAKTSTASHFKIRTWDPSMDSPYHTGGGAWEWIEVTTTISAAPSEAAFYLWCDAASNTDGSTIVYVSQPMLVFGASIGEGNYRPRQQEFIFGEVPILSNAYDGLTGQGDLAYTDVNLEADSDARIGKGMKAILVHTGIKDSGSGAAVATGIYLRKDATFATMSYANSAAGKTNDIEIHLIGEQGLDANGDFDIRLEATGVDTLDIDMFEYHGVQVN